MTVLNRKKNPVLLASAPAVLLPAVSLGNGWLILDLSHHVTPLILFPASFDSTICVVDAKTRRTVAHLHDHTDAITTMAMVRQRTSSATAAWRGLEILRRFCAFVIIRAYGRKAGLGKEAHWSCCVLLRTGDLEKDEEQERENNEKKKETRGPRWKYTREGEGDKNRETDGKGQKERHKT